MKNLVTIQESKVVTTSIQVANTFNKRHDHVLRDIENLRKDLPNFGEMYIESTQLDFYNRERKVFIMNRDGFALIAMGFTGKRALTFKVDYINAFNKMETQLRESSINETILINYFRDKLSEIKKLTNRYHDGLRLEHNINIPVYNLPRVFDWDNRRHLLTNLNLLMDDYFRSLTNQMHKTYLSECNMLEMDLLKRKMRGALDMVYMRLV